MSADEPERPRPRAAVLQVLALLVVGLAVPLGGLLLFWRSCTHTAMQGRVEVAGSAAGAWRAPLDRCAAVPGSYAPGAGEVTLGRRADNGPLARFTLDPLDGAIVTLWPPAGGASVTVRAADCPGLRASLRRTSSGVDGSLSATCPLAGGGTATIDVWFRGCAE